MQEIDQSLFITQLENEIENQLTEVIAVFQNLPASQLLQPSATGGWSIAQCFGHLNSYSDFYLPRLKKAFDKTATFSGIIQFKFTWLGSYFIKMMEPCKSKRKYKAMKRHQPDVAITDPHQVISLFIQQLEDLLQLLNESKEKELRKVYVITSLSSLVKINAGDAIQFVLTHNRRHIEQARRNL